MRQFGEVRRRIRPTNWVNKPTNIDRIIFTVLGYLNTNWQ